MLLTITDKFSKAIKLVACKTTDSAADIASLYLQQAYATFGLPVKIISDRDARFTSRFWRSLMDLLDVKLGMTTAFHPQADGQSEKTNATVKIALRCLLHGNEDSYSKWPDYLPILELEYNNLPNASTNEAPNDLRFALRPRGIPDLLSPISNTALSTSDTAQSMIDDLKNRRSDTCDAILHAQ